MADLITLNIDGFDCHIHFTYKRDLRIDIEELRIEVNTSTIVLKGHIEEIMDFIDRIKGVRNA